MVVYEYCENCFTRNNNDMIWLRKRFLQEILPLIPELNLIIIEYLNSKKCFDICDSCKYQTCDSCYNSCKDCGYFLCSGDHCGNSHSSGVYEYCENCHTRNNNNMIWLRKRFLQEILPSIPELNLIFEF
jgi:hypothetical protein